MVFLTIVVMARILTISKGTNPEVDQSFFPSSCASWSEAEGCTRITLQNATCTRPEDIPSDFSIVFEGAVGPSTKSVLENCVTSSLARSAVTYETDSNGGYYFKAIT